jgi:hypothetical protein
MEVRIAHHGHCFDGAASAALFSRYVRERIDPGAVFSYRGLAYEPNAPPIASQLREGATNIVVDFRYTRSPLLEWYFDHHVSAFQETGSKEHFAADTSGKKFHNGAYGSCTQLIADTLREKHGWEAPDLAELVRWADIVDAARFPNADVASGLDHPALEITAVIQEQGDDGLCADLIPRLASEPMTQIAASPLIAQRLAPIKTRLDALTARMAGAGEQRNNVAVFDLSEQPLDSVNKFVSYKLFPTAMYSVVLSWTPRRVKLSVGYNPWSNKPRRHNIAAICEGYGGGGHPVVGAISLPANELAKAKRIVEEVIDLLNR